MLTDKQDIMNIQCFTVGPFATNCYLIREEASNKAILVDPGFDSKRIMAQIDQAGLELKYIINTHCHIDHVAEAKLIQDRYSAPFYIHEDEMPILEYLPQQSSMFGLHHAGQPKVNAFVKDGDELHLGKINGRVIHTPGHSPGGICLLFGTHLFCGDTLFYDSIGRTDLMLGNHQQLLNSINEKLMVLEDETVIHPGHGEKSTIGRERIQNPFLH
jgi:hydroxyacylglutathione hydrolase